MKVIVKVEIYYINVELRFLFVCMEIVYSLIGIIES